MSKNKLRKKRFTLTEVMIVVVIIGLLAAIIVPNVIGKLGTAQEGTTKAQIKSLAQQASTFYLEKSRVPASLEELQEAKFIKEIPLDPWGNEYVYTVDESYFEGFNIVSAGKDGSIGTGDDISLNK